MAVYLAVYFLHQFHSFGGVFLLQSFCHVKEYRLVNGTHYILYLFQSHFLAAVKSKALIQNTQGITERAVRQLCHIAQSVFCRRKTFLIEIFHQCMSNIIGSDATEVEPLTTGKNGCRYFLGVCGCQNEDNVCRGFLQCFQQCVKSTVGQHMHFVDDIDLECAFCGGIFHFLPNLTDIVYAVVGSGVDFHDVDAAPSQNILTDFTFVTGLPIFCRMEAVDGTGKNFRCGCFAGASGAAEQIGMGHTPCFHLIFQCFHNMILPHHAGKDIGAEFSV